MSDLYSALAGQGMNNTLLSSVGISPLLAQQQARHNRIYSDIEGGMVSAPSIVDQMRNDVKAWLEDWDKS